MSRPTTITVTAHRGRPSVTVEPAAAPVTAEVIPGERQLRVSLRGHGEAFVRFEGIDVADVDVRGGYALVEPGTPCVVRASVDGWLSITARLRLSRPPRPRR